MTQPGPQDDQAMAQADVEAVLAQHRLWVGTAGLEGQRASFAGCTIVGFDFSQHLLRGMHLEDEAVASQVAAKQDVALGVGASFNAAVLQRCNFALANLSGCDFQAAIVDGCDFSGTSAQGAKWQRATLKDSDFGHARFDGALLAYAKFSACHLQGAHLWAALGLSDVVLDGQCLVDDETRLGHALDNRSQVLKRTQQFEDATAQMRAEHEQEKQRLESEAAALRAQIHEKQEELEETRAEVKEMQALGSRLEAANDELKKAKDHAKEQLGQLRDFQNGLKALTKYVLWFVLFWLCVVAVVALLVPLDYVLGPLDKDKLASLRGWYLVFAGVGFAGMTVALVLNGLIGRMQRQMLTFSNRIMAVDTYSSMVWFASALDPKMTQETVQQGIAKDAELRVTFQDIKQSALAEVKANRGFKDNRMGMSFWPNKAWLEFLRDEARGKKEDA